MEDSSVVSFMLPAHQGEAEWHLLHVVTTLITDEGMGAEGLVERLLDDLEGAIQIDGCSLAQKGQLVGIVKVRCRTSSSTLMSALKKLSGM